MAGLAKSAQVPRHFWLPRAMAAPTPVSAYLHSAAMVAAGVLLLSRCYPLIEPSRLLLDGLLVVGLASIAVGGLIALTRDRLKQVLAYSTVSQCGYVVTMLGLGGAKAVLAANPYVVAHALSKSALFASAGAVTGATGEDRLSLLLAVPALWRPVAAAVSGAGRRVGPESAYRRSIRGLNRLSTAIHDLEVRDLRTRVAAVLCRPACSSPRRSPRRRSASRRTRSA